MKRIDTIIIGAGQAGLAMSHCLSERSVRHVVIERGEVANSWRRERWDSLRLLTPNWQSRLPGYAYSGPAPDAFMSMPEIIRHLEGYAAISAAPVETTTTVLRISADSGGYRVDTDRGAWGCRNLVLASGACNLANVPAIAATAPADIQQLTPLQYRRPSQLAPGGVLVVGASATGVQLAAELLNAGHEVTLAAGEHIRMPRHYRGRDIQWWMEASGVHSAGAESVDDINRARRVPSLQLVGSSAQQFLDLNALQACGAEIVGRLVEVNSRAAQFSGSLANHCKMSDLKMNRLLASLDQWADATGLEGLPPPERFEPTALPAPPRLSHDLTRGRFRTIIWATGFRPDHSWLDLPVFDAKGRLAHDGGLVAPGLYALGLPFLRRRNSALIDGVGADAKAIASHILQTRGRLAA